MPSAAVQKPPAKKTTQKRGSKKPPATLPAPAAAAPHVRPVPLTPPQAEAERVPVPVSLPLLPEVINALQAEAQKRGTTFEAVAADALHRGLRQILWGDPSAALLKRMGLAPRKPLPPGKTLKNVMDELRNSLPPDENDPYTDEDYRRVLERD